MEYLKTEIDIRIDWSEMDLFGHVNNVAYFKYVQASRVNYCETVGINTYNPNIKQSFAVAASNCEFKQPLFYPEEICIISTVEWIKNTSFKLNHFVYNSKKELVATANDIIVLFDYATNSKILINESIKSKMIKQ